MTTPSSLVSAASRESTRAVERELARRAIELALPAVRAAIADREICGAGFLHIVVMSPTLNPRDQSFEAAIVGEHSEGDVSAWDADYRAFALDKARLSWRTGMGSHELQTLRPHLLVSGDTALWGSVAIDGIVVAVSGAHPWYDEAFASMVAVAYRALAKARAARRDPESTTVA